MKRQLFIGLALILFLGSCAAHQHEVYNKDQYIIYGFWYGLWHGIISPITFVIGLFSDHVTVWETHNNGGWYTFGFLLGVGTLTGSSGRASKQAHLINQNKKDEQHYSNKNKTDAEARERRFIYQGV